MSDQVATSGDVHVVGTAHVSEDSVREVEEAIASERPDVVAVELDEARFRQLRGETPEDLDAGDLLRGNTVFQFLAYWMLSYVQARLGERFDIDPGADMLAAVDTAEELDIDVALVDRDIQVTMQRFWARLSFLEKIQLVVGLAAGVGGATVVGLGFGLSVGMFVAILAEVFVGPVLLPAGALGGLTVVLDGFLVAVWVGVVLGAATALALAALTPENDEFEEFDPETLTDADVVSAMMEEFRRFSPGGAEALIDERDAYIAHQLRALRDQGLRVVAVVGAGHREGIERYLEDPAGLPPLADITGRQRTGWFSPYRLVGYLFTLGFLAFFVLVAMAGVGDAFLMRLFAAWFLVNAVFAFGLAKLAGAHWTSAGVGGAVAWLTSVNPLLAPGWFAGYVELRYTDVNVADITTLNEIIADEESPFGDVVGRMFEVPLFRLIMIVAMTNIGSFIGSILFATVLIPWLFADIGGPDQIARLMLDGAENSLDLLLGGLQGVL